MNRTKVFAWTVYDLANTAFSALFVTFFFPLFVKAYLGGNEFQIGLVFGLSMLAVGLVVPFLGTLSDMLKNKVSFLAFFTIMCIVFTAFTGFMNLFWALLFGAFAHFCYHAALTFYNAILPSLVPEKKLGRVSGYGVAAGYVGTVLSLGMTFLILNFVGWESREGIVVMFPAIAFFYLVFSSITFVFIKDKPNNNAWLPHILPSLRELKKTIFRLHTFQGIIPFFCSIFMYTNAINAATVFLYLYGREEISLTVPQFMIVYVIFSIAAAIGSFVIGFVTDRIGPKHTLFWTGVLWIGVVFLLIRVTSYSAFLVAGIFGGIAMGAVWTASRPLLISLAPRRHITQFFGFTELTDKFSGVLGPILFGYLVVAYNYSVALYSLIAFFVIGLLFLLLIKKR